MKIFIFNNGSYPYGYALTKRFHLYAKGIINNGHEVKIIIPKPTEQNKETKNVQTSGIFDSVPFLYTSRKTLRSTKFVNRRIDDFYGYVNSCFLILKNPPDIIITSSFPFVLLVFLKICCLIINCKLVREKNEIDSFVKDDLGFFDRVLIKLTNNLVSGFIVINKYLEDYIKNDLKLKKDCLVVPILVQPFNEEFTGKLNDTIMYTGTYLERKDGILSILHAFNILIKKHPTFRLILTGNPSSSKDYKEIEKIINLYELRDNIDFVGYLSQRDLEKELIHARVLVLAKPQNRQNRYNYPTKMGEYLISGRPVLTTKVGIIGELLTHKKNVFFTPFSVKDIASNLEYILNDSVLADKVGGNGKVFAKENYDFNRHGENLIKFFSKISDK
ncbi:glycosyltransferase family 4 protein [Ancylomarina sp. 16SWW S1-10-2]|uniref:glycosyltransferase family 4 protein n=1 Tax=Ancylomarina sp. 16SWW S1-10-2 TaxID=2499681 RepID=UPI0012AE2D84|nr:glycosyltransferase family 4 protein [Ancylomarina sp. 16SWW S1-10-2]MRT91926.1 glycosyltransferase [Ancylomarina sp. 16SWW S1-10-2]